jgi:Bacterial regulatory proteins, luxR family
MQNSRTFDHDRPHAGQLAPAHSPALAPRERDIARELDLAESTVQIHVRNVLRKLNLSSRVQIAIHALAQELNG